MSETYFGKMMQSLAKEAGIKNSSLAEGLKYDVSYISKWMNGKSLPSEKNAVTLIPEIAKIMGKSDEQRVEYENKLKQAYEKSIEAQKKELSQNNFETSMPVSNFVKKIEQNRKNDDIAIMDILSIDHEGRLSLAYIENGHFSVHERDKTKRLYYGINLDGEKNRKDIIYDAIFIIHMLTSLSPIDFKLFEVSEACGKIVYVIEDDKFISGMVTNSGHDVLCVNSGRGINEAKKIRAAVTSMFCQEQLLFVETSMDDMVRNQNYIRSVISVKIRWLLGHMCEVMLPDSVFDEILEELSFENKEELRRLHVLTSEILLKPDTRIMMYESALSEFVINGEIDFFNRKYILPNKSRLKVIEYIKNSNFGLRLVDGGFSRDFQYITNPCLFVADSVCYVRLENGRYEDNILLINNRKVKSLFEDFYEEIWSGRSDVVISDELDVASRLEHYQNSLQIFEKI